MCEKQSSANIVEQGNIKYLLNKKEKTASVIGLIEEENEDLLIPRSIYHESEEYEITKLSELSLTNFKGELLSFAPDSKIRIIEKDALYDSLLKSITIPSSLIELKEGWCNNTKELDKVTVSPDNQRYISISDQIIQGKTKLEQNHYDIFVFLSRSKDTVLIPNTIEIIDSYSLQYCKVKQVQFQSDSKLLKICSNSFQGSTMKKLKIPTQLTEIGELSFSECFNLTKFTIPPDSKLQKIGKKAFFKTKISFLTIPPYCTEICEKCFYGADKLKTINCKNNDGYFTIEEGQVLIERQTNKIVFVYHEKKQISIPNYIEIIGKKVFYYSSISYVVFPPDSKLRIIDDSAFYKTYIGRIKIPSSVEKIGKYAFASCNELKEVDIPSDSKIHTIGKGAFFRTLIDKFSLPSHVTKICEYTFYDCKLLKQFDIPSDSELEIIEKEAFIFTKIEKFIVPRKVTKFCEYCFSFCPNLSKIEIPTDSNLQTIEKYALPSLIESIFIPSNCTDLNDKWNFNLKNLNKITVSKDNKKYISVDDKFVFGKSNMDQENYDIFVHCARNVTNVMIPENIEIIGTFCFNFCNQIDSFEISKDSKLRLIKAGSFSYSSIKEISIPFNVTHICEFAFEKCSNLNKVTFLSNSTLQTIDDRAFSHTSIDRISIPSSVSRIGKYCFSFTKLLHANIQPNTELKIIGEYAFSDSLIESFSLPSKISEIKTGTFNNCRNLKCFYFADDSILEIIGDYAFHNSRIQKFSFPSKLRIISNHALSELHRTSFVFHEDPKIEYIGNCAFADTYFRSFIVPQSINHFNEYAFMKSIFVIIEFPMVSELFDVYFTKNHFSAYRYIFHDDDDLIIMIPFGSNIRIIVY